MPYDREETTSVPVELANGTTIQVEVSKTGREDVGFSTLPFKQVTDTLQEIVVNLKETLEKVKPDKASVKFGVEMVIESGSLTAMIVKGTGKGNLEITIGWGK